MSSRYRVDGPVAHANWNAMRQRKKRREGFEVPLHGDAFVTGQIEDELGPYAFLNTIQGSADRGLPLVLRCWIHLSNDHFRGSMDETDVSKFHGGGIAAELAALAGLALGVRLRAGGITRDLRHPRDCGMPRTPSPADVPHLPGPRRTRVLPRIGGAVRLDSCFVGRMKSYPDLEPETAIGLVRAARLYSDAIWVAESQPELAWLMLVSALEAGANSWNGTTGPDPVRTLRAARPKLVSILEEADAKLVPKIARELAGTMKATKKFIDFVMKFEPGHGPTTGDLRWGRFKWTRTGLRKALGKIYDYRSRALHDGTPFPVPMCIAPMWIPDSKQWTEVPTGNATAALGGTWVRSDTPMLLHMFEYLTREVLLGWWTTLAG